MGSARQAVPGGPRPAIHSETRSQSRMEIADKKNRLRGPWSVFGLALAVGFGGWLLSCLYLSCCGSVVRGSSGRVPANTIRSEGAPVIYFFNVGETSYHGWRRGIQWGEQPLAVVYCRFLPRMHLTSLRAGITTPRALWEEADFLLRAFLGTLGSATGLLLVLYGDRMPTSLPKGWHFLHGLDFHHHHHRRGQ